MATIKHVAFGGVIYSQCSAEYLLSMGVDEGTVNAALSAQLLEDAQVARRAAYAAESDPLYLEWQYDQTAESEQAWRDKVTEIKARYPLPGE
ncbi:hypothetical protein D3C77_523410 [compost metagenome]